MQGLRHAILWVSVHVFLVKKRYLESSTMGLHLNDIHELVKLFYNLPQNFFSSTDNYGKESLILVQTNSKGFDAVTSSSKDPCNPVYYTNFIPHEH